jgi:hypothetical protein
MDLVYCAGGNEALMRIAYESGMLLGIRSDRLSYGFAIRFVDINYRHPPTFEDHLRVVARYQPRFAVVRDLSEHSVDEADIERATREARVLSDYCEVPLVVPKLGGQLALLPDDLAIGVSLPTTHGGAQYAFWELTGRRIHLLGGNPAVQMEAYRYLSACNHVLSTDGNMAQKVAWSAGFWEEGHWVDHPSKGTHRPNLAHTCFGLSCCNIVQEWRQFFAQEFPGQGGCDQAGRDRPVLAGRSVASGRGDTHVHR